MGDVLDRLREMPDESVHCVVTSPPYWGLRDYGTASWDGGDPACDHKPNGHGERPDLKAQGLSTWTTREWSGAKSECRCGARRIDQQLGLEPTPAAYLARMVEVFREVRRVLRSDGTCWVNMAGGYTDKQMDGMPWRLAFALQDDGWYLRSEIIWHKPNPMPESVSDRPTKAHEQIFLLTKAKTYFYDADAIREDAVKFGTPGHMKSGNGNRHPNHQAVAGMSSDPSAGRNARDVWSIPTEPFPDAHFATFPTELPRRCISAGTSERGVCPQCGAPWTRVVEKLPAPHDGTTASAYASMPNSTAHRISLARQAQRERGHEPVFGAITTGWQPSCTHGGDPIPATVLDPFAGSGTTVLVALRLGRSGIGIELNPAYADMARKRILDDHGAVRCGAVQPTNGDTPHVVAAQGRFDI